MSFAHFLCGHHFFRDHPYIWHTTVRHYKGGLRYWASEQATALTEISFQQQYCSSGTSRKADLVFVLQLPGIMLPMRVTVTSPARLIVELNKKTDFSTNIWLARLPRGDLDNPPTPTPHLFLPKMTIITNNDRDIPPRFRQAVTNAIGHSRDCYTVPVQLRKLQAATYHILKFSNKFRP